MPLDPPTLEALCASVERAWRDRRDYTAAERFAAQYPDDAHHFYTFLAGLLAEDLGVAEPAAAMQESARRTTALVERASPARGTDDATKSRTGVSGPRPPQGAPAGAQVLRSPPPRDSTRSAEREVPVSLFSFLRQRTGRAPAAIATALGASVQFLMGLSRVPRLPGRAAEALAARIAESFGIAVEETLAVLARGAPSTAFASSAGPGTSAPLQYGALVKTAKLAPSDEAYWLAFVSDDQDAAGDAEHTSPTTRRSGT